VKTFYACVLALLSFSAPTSPLETPNADAGELASTITGPVS
jgi:hypothetical protein